jgi:hypothetical protein
MALNADSCRSQPGSQAVVGEARRAASADAVVSVDALHLAPDLAAAGREVLRILGPQPSAGADQLATADP